MAGHHRADRRGRDAAEGQAAADRGGEEATARVGPHVPGRGGEGALRRSGPRPPPAVEQRRVQLHGPRPHRRRSATDARVPRRRRRGRGLHQRRRSAHRHLAGALHQVPERVEGHRRPRRTAARRLPLLAVQDAPRLDRRGHRRAADVLRRPRAGRRQAVGASVPARHRAQSRRARGRQGRGGRGEGEGEREVPRRAVGDAHRQDTLAPARFDPREVAHRDRPGRAGARGGGDRAANGTLADGSRRQLHSGALGRGRRRGRVRRQPDAAGAGRSGGGGVGPAAPRGQAGAGAVRGDALSCGGRSRKWHSG